MQEIKEVSKFVVSRYIYKSVKRKVPTIEEVFLHTYTDPGEEAWGIAIYLRFLNEEINRYESHLIYSSTRVAPTKSKLSVPKKELNGVVH